MNKHKCFIIIIMIIIIVVVVVVTVIIIIIIIFITSTPHICNSYQSCFSEDCMKFEAFFF